MADGHHVVLLHKNIFIALAGRMELCVWARVKDLIWEQTHGSQSVLWIQDALPMKSLKLACSYMHLVSFQLQQNRTQLMTMSNIFTSTWYVGGNDGSSSLNSVERYDVALNKWTIVTSMFTRRSSIGAAVLECFNLERGLLQTSIWPTLLSSLSLDKECASSGCNNA